MLKLKKEELKDQAQWEEAGITPPQFDYQNLVDNTKENPEWVHFGAGNIFRAFIARLQQELLNEGEIETGIIAAEGFDYEIIDKVYKPADNLSLVVKMFADGKLEKTLLASITEGLKADSSFEKDWAELKEIFRKPSLKMASFTVTEKGYSLDNMEGEFFPFVLEDFKAGPEGELNHLMAKVTALAYERFKAGAYPFAFASMDNCSHNGQKLKDAVITMAEKWLENDLVEEGFLGYLNDQSKVGFPWSMIDKITPGPAADVQQKLKEIGFKNTEIVKTNKNTEIAAFVNSEAPEYLVIEDSFPNGKIPLDKAGAIYTDRDTVNQVETMKVTTCLNPLHTAMAVYGCLLGHTSIAEEMEDQEIRALVEQIGYKEGLPVVVDPGVLDPKDFIDEVVNERLVNPYIPDTPQRIAKDTSQKVAIRFGETIKSYRNAEDLDPADLVVVPLAIAGWLRYLLAVDDQGNEMPLSSDPMLDELTPQLEGIEIGNPETVGDKLKSILSNENLMGLDLYEVGLGEKIEKYFKEMIAEEGAVRATLNKYLL
ncbi:fructuronate reductase [Halanaerobium congolense]|jgi:fructuronate reductase|uniref:Fructuronate reductase n=1 Tax=Halanaerobium congolense TaxID=54121 RepID=A0A1M7KNS0_9FIRM|nr:mannitol dehydrogenase family protein [Halanaerobium congolense]KXS50367.1 MAG: fructuronate reductase [Halanaerobium sp. T82-1]PUU92374.1 MAG: fructuronate reductase [Halanaerobium sp.]PTX15925.1 fructuronate reductase [Halanaerobium congolense]TDP17998.1 fructuronate reductase [Halanaerobium congolense]TDX44454.1 fructuronate reductase [Halanaerobium congolense]